ncbi:riboflavin synthase, partial [Vibrio cholerae]|nr:riboflavin synthase [Vibrio cholerae]
EVDLLARYLERLLLGERAAESSAANSGGVSMDLLARSGFLR